MKTLGIFAILAALVTLCLAGLVVVRQDAEPAGAQTDDNGKSPLLEMLSFVPDSYSTLELLTPINYVDFRANDAATGFNIYTEYESTGNLWVLPLRRVPFAGGQYLMLQLQDGQAAVGFTYADVDRILEFGDPPQNVTVYQGNIDPDAVGAALAARDFELSERGGIPVWHRFEDSALDIESRNPADPFGGDLGMAARVAMFENGILANTRSWAFIEPVISAHVDGHSLADRDDYRTLAEAAESGGVDVIHAWIFTAFGTANLLLPPGDPMSEIATRRLPPELQMDTTTWGSLPVPVLTAWTDHQEGQDTVHSFILLYGDEATAQAAAEEVALRLGTMSAELVADLGISVDAPRIYMNDTEYVAAVASIRYPIQIDPEADFEENIQPGIMFWRWMTMFFNRVFILLVADVEILAPLPAP